MITILKYNAGNVTSVFNAVQSLGYEACVTDNVELLRKADKVIFPGVGHAKYAMQYLKGKQLDALLLSLEQPVLGICLGMQLMCQHSEEGNTLGLGIFDAQVKLFPPDALVPHMGWNDFKSVKGALFEGLEVMDDCYFVHSYYATLAKETVAETDYILPFSAALQKDNFYAVQFHPEKSGKNGMRLLSNFLSL